jgi:CBS-domain-containing membrane protein
VRLFDEKFIKDPMPYLIQSLLAGFMIAIILLVLNAVTETALIAALASSAFIAFTMPHSYFAKPRSLLGGYFVSSIIGIACDMISTHPHAIGLFQGPQAATIALAAFSVAMSIFVMVITDTEHAPATGLALGFVLNPWNMVTIVLILFSISFMATSKRLLKGWMIDLI